MEMNLAKNIFEAIENRDLYTIKSLLAQGFNTAMYDQHSQTFLCIAIEKGDLEVVKELISRNINYKDDKVESSRLLHVAVKANHKEIIEYLLHKKVSINSADSDGNTPLWIAITEHKAQIVACLLRDPRLNLNIRCHGEMPIDYAKRQGNEEIIELLEEKRADARYYSDEETNLHIAAKTSDIQMMKRLVNEGINIEVRCKEGRTPLHAAVSEGQLESVQFLCNNGADVNARTNRNSTPLHFVSIAPCASLEIARLLINNGAIIDARNVYDYTPLQCSLNDKKFEISEFLLEKGANINAIYCNAHYARYIKSTLLHWAARRCYTNCIKFLVKRGANINATECDGRTPLCLAVKHNCDLDIIEFLIEHGADLHIKNGAPPLYWAYYVHNIRMQKLLIEKGTDVNTSIDSWDIKRLPLHLTTDLSIARLLVEKGANVNGLDVNGNTPLHHISSLPVVKYLVQNGANVNSTNNEGNTPLHTNHNFFIVEYLIEKGANVNAANLEGYTPLHLATKIAIAEYLVEKGADVNVLTKNGKTVLHTIAEYKNYNFLPDLCELVKIFINKGIDVNVNDKNGDTPLHLCVKTKQNQVAIELLKNGAREDVHNNEGKTPFDMNENIKIVGHKSELLDIFKEGATMKILKDYIFRIIKLYNSYIFNYLSKFQIFQNNASKLVNILRQIDINIHDTDYWMPLHYAVQNGKKDMVITLLSSGAMYNAETLHGDTPLNLAKDDEIKELLCLVEQLFHDVKSANYEKVKQCIEKEKAIVNARDKDGNTPLLWAIKNNEKEDIAVLLLKEADITLTDNVGTTSLHLAASKGNKNLAERLLKITKQTRQAPNFVNRKTVEGTTPLHLAANSGSLEVTKLLLKEDAFYNVKDREGKMPIDFSTNQGNTDFLQSVDVLFNYAKNGHLEFIDALNKLEFDILEAILHVRNKYGHSLKEIIKANEYEHLQKSVDEYEKKIKSLKKNRINLSVNDKQLSDEGFSDDDAQYFGLFE